MRNTQMGSLTIRRSSLLLPGAPGRIGDDNCTIKVSACRRHALKTKSLQPFRLKRLLTYRLKTNLLVGSLFSLQHIPYGEENDLNIEG